MDFDFGAWIKLNLSHFWEWMLNVELFPIAFILLSNIQQGCYKGS